MDECLSQTIFPVERASRRAARGRHVVRIAQFIEDDDVRESADRATRLLTDWPSKEAQLDS